MSNGSGRDSFIIGSNPDPPVSMLTSVTGTYRPQPNSPVHHVAVVVVNRADCVAIALLVQSQRTPKACGNTRSHGPSPKAGVRWTFCRVRLAHLTAREFAPSPCATHMQKVVRYAENHRVTTVPRRPVLHTCRRALHAGQPLRPSYARRAVAGATDLSWLTMSTKAKLEAMHVQHDKMSALASPVSTDAAGFRYASTLCTTNCHSAVGV